MNQDAPLNIDVNFAGKTIRIAPEARAEFAKDWSLDILIPRRYSALLIVDLMMHQKLNHLNPQHVIDEISRLENPASNGITKPATPFSHAPLSPLWHQHYFAESFVPDNILLELQKKGRWQEIFNGALGPEGSRISKAQLGNLVEEAMEGSLNKRSDATRITGEWIVFAKRPSGNIYLCLAGHKTGDQVIFDKLSYACSREFPDLEPFCSSRI